MCPVRGREARSYQESCVGQRQGKKGRGERQVLHHLVIPTEKEDILKMKIKSLKQRKKTKIKKRKKDKKNKVRGRYRSRL
jgi:hypothetical protein